jgi:hypothetical protein
MSSGEFSSGIDIARISNKEYRRYDTDRPKWIVLGLEGSSIPYFARFTNKQISLVYDKSCEDSVDEIVGKVMSGDYEEILREIKDKKNADGCLILLPEVASILNTTVGTLKCRPNEVQEALCLTYVNCWLCDTLTIQRELSRFIELNSNTKADMEQAELRNYQQNNTPEKRGVENSADIQHRMNVIQGDEDYSEKARQTANEESREFYISREVQKSLSDMLREKHRAEERSRTLNKDREQKVR